MYVWKNANRRDRRRPRHPEAVSASKSAVPKDLREWRARCVAKAAAERDKVEALEAHEVEARTAHVKYDMESYLRTECGLLELSAVSEVLRLQEEEARAAQHARERAEAEESRLEHERVEVQLARRRKAAPKGSVAEQEAVQATRHAALAHKKRAAEARARHERCRVQGVFRHFDADGSGAIDSVELAELMAALCVPVRGARHLAELMLELDADGSGDVDFEEFYEWYERRAAQLTGGAVNHALQAALQASKLGAATARALPLLTLASRHRS